MDFRHILVDYCVDNNIMFSNEANWRKIAKDEKFRGCATAYYLKGLYHDLKATVKKTNPGIKVNELTSETLQNYLATMAKKSETLPNYWANMARKEKLSKKYKKLHEDFVKIRNAFQ